MEFKKFIDEKQKKEFFINSNITYIVAFGIGFLLTLVFGMLGAISVTIAAFVATFIVGISIILNVKGRYGVATLLFVIAVSTLASMLTVMFGLQTGFQYLFFSMILVIIFSGWTNILKIIAIVCEGALFLAAVIFVSLNSPLREIDNLYVLLFLIFNVAINVFAIARIANHSLKIAKKAENTLTEFAETDYLTKLPNRAGFHSFVKKMKETRFANSALPNLVFLMIDLDNFKDVNDLYGHAVGDLLLIEIGRVFKKALSENDFLSRYGGEEFVIVHFVDHEEDALPYANNLRESIESRKFRFGDIDIKLTISIGALFKPGTCLLNCEEILEDADILLYQAKKAGRNRVIIKSLN